MSREMDRRRTTTYDLTLQEREMLAEAAKREHLSVSQFVAAAVRNALKKKATIVVLVMLYAWPARAECSCETDPETKDCTGPVTCDPGTFNGLAHTAQDTERDLTACTAKVDRLEPANKQLAAELAQHIDGPTWQTVALSGVGGLALGVIVALLAR